MQLKDLCVFEVACCTRDISVSEAARLMRAHHTGDLIVIDNADEEREPVGIVTDRDIVVEVLAQGRNPDKTTVGDVMSKQIVIAAGSEDAEQALQRMVAHGVRRIPVVDDEQYVMGIVTLDDMLRIHAEQANSLAHVISKEQSREQRARR
jgi:CBS domain-containing protein